MNLLEGITIIDFTRLLPGPIATHLLAQMGARVIKIESPKRIDYARKGITEVDGASVLFHQLNHNKELKLVDYNSPEGKAEVLELIQSADILIEQFRPGAMDAWGLGYHEIKKIHPGLVYVSLTGYGQTGAFAKEAGHDINYMAYSGLLSMMKDEQGKPVVPGAQFADISGAYMAVIALQAALLQKNSTGVGSFVDVSLCGALMPFLSIPYSLYGSGLDHRQYNIINGKTTVNYTNYQCADGKWLSLGALEIKFWNTFCELINKPDWKKSNQLELMNFAFPKMELDAFFQTKTRDEWTAFFKGKEVCIAPILEMEELEGHEIHKSQATFEEFKTADGSKLKTVGLPFKVIKDNS